MRRSLSLDALKRRFNLCDDAPAPVEEALRALVLDINQFPDIFEDQRVGIGKTHGGKSEVIILSRVGIAAMLHDRVDVAEEVETEIRQRRADLKDLRLPVHLKWDLGNQAANEWVEFALFKTFYPVVFSGAKVGTVPDHDDLDVEPQVYLSGLADVPGELSKAVDHRVISSLKRGEILSRSERLKLRLKFIEVGQQIHNILEEFETTYELVMATSYQRRGWEQTYRGLLMRVMRAIVIQEQLVLTAIEQTPDNELNAMMKTP